MELPESVAVTALSPRPGPSRSIRHVGSSPRSGSVHRQFFDTVVFPRSPSACEHTSAFTTVGSAGDEACRHVDLHPPLSLYPCRPRRRRKISWSRASLWRLRHQCVVLRQQLDACSAQLAILQRLLPLRTRHWRHYCRKRRMRGRTRPNHDRSRSPQMATLEMLPSVPLVAQTNCDSDLLDTWCCRRARDLIREAGEFERWPPEMLGQPTVSVDSGADPQQHVSLSSVARDISELMQEPLAAVGVDGFHERPTTASSQDALASRTTRSPTLSSSREVSARLFDAVRAQKLAWVVARDRVLSKHARVC